MKVSRLGSRFAAGICLTGLMLTLGCAGATFKKVSADGSTNGIRYYRPATYVLVKPDYDKGTASVSFMTMPDTSQAYSIDPYAYAATNTTDVEFNKGMLSGMTSDADSTKIAADGVAALSQVAQSVLTTAAKSAELAAAARVAEAKGQGNPPPPVFLYVVTGDSVKQLYPPK